MIISLIRALICAILTILLFGLAACASRMPAPVVNTSAASATVAPPATQPPTSTMPVFTATAAVPTSTPVPPPSPIASPLEGISLAELPQAVSNAYIQPLPGRDDGHHGTDFAFYRWKDKEGMEGWQINSVLDGIVAAVITNSEVYGRMVIIETPLERLPANWQQRLPTYQPTMVPDARVECPPLDQFKLDFTRKSLYLLYGHMQDIESLTVGGQVSSGQKLGTVGNTGRSGNPHLHLELRVGPAGAAFPGMSHYTAAATLEERANYCLWRVSETFQLLEPMSILTLAGN